MSMLGLRDFVVVAPASSFHQHTAEPVFSDHHHHHHHHHQISGNSATALGIGVGVFPLLATGPCLVEEGGKGHVGMMEEEGVGGMGTVSCTDCGNKAKKDCKFRRCRTCCKSRGFQCHTHVKSTWVPAARRRERQLMMGGVAVDLSGGGGGGGTSTESSSGEAKRSRVVVVGGGGSQSHNTASLSHNSVSNASKSLDTCSTRQDGNLKETLPGQVKAPAVFRCVRVTAIEEGDDEFAYQAMVKIGGHVFKGFLYDQGSDYKNRQMLSSSSGLHLNMDTGSCHHQRDSSSSSPIPGPTIAFSANPPTGMLVFGGAG